MKQAIFRIILYAIFAVFFYLIKATDLHFFLEAFIALYLFEAGIYLLLFKINYDENTGQPKV